MLLLMVIFIFLIDNTSPWLQEKVCSFKSIEGMPPILKAQDVFQGKPYNVPTRVYFVGPESERGIYECSYICVCSIFIHVYTHVCMLLCACACVKEKRRE